MDVVVIPLACSLNSLLPEQEVNSCWHSDPLLTVTGTDDVIIKKCKCVNQDCNCKSIVRTFYSYSQQMNRDKYGSNGKEKKQINQVNLSDQSVYFHLNEDLLHDFRFALHAPTDQADERVSNECYRDKSVLLVGCGSIKRLPVLLSIKKLRLRRLVCLAREKVAWAAAYVDEWIEAEHETVQNKEQTLAAVHKYMERNKMRRGFDAIVTYDDLCTMQTAYLAEQFGLPGIPFDISTQIKNKHTFRTLSKQLNINHPRFFLLSSSSRKDYLTHLGSKIGQEQPILNSLTSNEYCKFPLIVKNVYGVGKDFVKKCENLKEFCSAVDESVKVNAHMDLLVEEFFDGHEIDCEVLIQNNEIQLVIVSDNFPPLEPHFFEQGGVTPSIALTGREHERVQTLLARWIRALGLNNACLHFEARCRPLSLYSTPDSTPDSMPDSTSDNNQHQRRGCFDLDENANVVMVTDDEEEPFLMPIEINLRLAGAETWSMVKASYDIDLIREVVNIGLGLPLDKHELIRRRSEPRFRSVSKDFHPAKNVLIESIAIDLNRLMKMDSAVEISIFRSVGDRLTAKDYVGWVSVINDKNAFMPDLNTKLDEVISCIQMKFADY